MTPERLTTYDTNGVAQGMGLTIIGVAIICKVNPYKVEEFHLRDFRIIDLPTAWRESGTRRVREAETEGATGHNLLVAATVWWARQYGNVEFRDNNYYLTPTVQWWDE